MTERKLFLPIYTRSASFRMFDSAFSFQRDKCRHFKALEYLKLKLKTLSVDLIENRRLIILLIRRTCHETGKQQLIEWSMSFQ